MTNQELIQLILSNKTISKDSAPINKELFTRDAKGNNEFLFFIKPEITIDNPAIQFEDILNLIFDKIKAFKLSIKNIRVLNAAYLKEHNIIAQHYGVINLLSKDIRSNIAASAKETFKEKYGLSFDEAEVYGSLEFQEAYPEFTPTGLSILWQNAPFIKLAGGTYSQKLEFDGKTVFVINGFHPKQLEHFIAEGRSIITMTLVGDTDWSVARNELIGKTDPTAAVSGSIRRELLDNKDNFGLSAVSSSWNGVHLSAGPVEGLIELMRYNSDFESDSIAKPTDYQFGEKLQNEFNAENVELLLENPNYDYKGKSESVFDITEEMNSDDALKVLKELY